MKPHHSLRTNVAIVAASFLLGASAFSLHQAHACDKRGGNELGEEFELVVVDSTIEGEPRIRYWVDVGDGDILYKNGRKGTRIVLGIVGLSFERASR